MRVSLRKAAAALDVALPTLQRGIEKGRLTEASVSKSREGRYSIDVDVARVEWERNRARMRPPALPPALAVATRFGFDVSGGIDDGLHGELDRFPWCVCCPDGLGLPTKTEVKRSREGSRSSELSRADVVARFGSPLPLELAGAVTRWQQDEAAKFSKLLVDRWVIARGCRCIACRTVLEGLQADAEHQLRTRHGIAGCPNCWYVWPPFRQYPCEVRA